MATAPHREPYQGFTLGEFLAFERVAEARHEWIDGSIYAMAGGSRNHARLCVRLGSLLDRALEETSCEAYGSDMAVLSGPRDTRRDVQRDRGLYSYPDLSVVCGPAQYLDAQQDVLLNPRVLIEVLSPTTEAFDRGDKRERYFTYLESIEEYLLVAQDRPAVDHWRKEPEGVWHSIEVVGLDASVHLHSLGVTLSLAEVYARVEFPETP